MSAPAYLSGRALEERLGISRATRYRWERDGYLPKRVRLGPGTLRYVVAEIEAFEARAAADRGGDRRAH